MTAAAVQTIGNGARALSLLGWEFSDAKQSESGLFYYECRNTRRGLRIITAGKETLQDAFAAAVAHALQRQSQR